MSITFDLYQGNTAGIRVQNPDREEALLESAISTASNTLKTAGLVGSNRHRTTLGNLWLEMLNKELEINLDKLHITTAAQAYTNTDLENIANNLTRIAPVQFASLSATRFQIIIVHVRRGLGIFDLYKNNANAFNMHHLPGMTPHLIMNKNHRIDVYEYDNVPGLFIVTNQRDDLSFTKILSCLWSFMSYGNLNTRYRETSIAENRFLELCSLLYSCDVEGYHTFLNRMYAEYEAYKNTPEYQAEMLAKFTEIINANYFNDIKARISSLEDNIASRQEQLMTYYTNLREAQLDLQSRELLGETNNRAMQDMMAFIQRSNGNIQMIDVDQNESRNIIFDITTPINSYRRKDVEPFFKGSSNMFTNNSKVAHAIKRIFIDEEYSLMTKTRVSIAFSGTNTYAGLNIPDNPYLPNPHLQQYSCFSNAKVEAHKAMLQQNYIAAIAQIATACGTLTFTDGTVMRHFAHYMKEALDTDKQIIKNNATGELLTIEELYKREKETTTPTPEGE